MILIISFVILGYFVGSIPTGYLFTNYLFGVDITQKGSGNIGATNVARIFGKKFFFLIFFLDAGKAFLFLLLCRYFVCDFNFLFLIAVFILLGNAYSPFLRFRGGKGVATSFGLLLFLYPLYLLLPAVWVWIFIFALSKRVDISSLFSFLFILIFSLFIVSPLSYDFIFLLFVFIFVSFRHVSNIKNLLKNFGVKS
ncbi:TPA: acyl-phosphate glycerol 3-phosphate acyltransferase [Candidatus Dependentiae bacterium]|nr:MAG: Glycerol-3-phosphate acyltransferase [candidate division TM6 bacterium GW2011_GWE2_31_21]KKP53769.1 MAG: Glycerol-3-phosphate acyltransferase [candidate division TM6 bacterium GW2011_GWF2_33_332]HBS48477.1 acyl-phosphate glycerol 3-phosphate acyltransferase [Candidatus Dependentiae bacterium]HBZ73092.1 acyl-phosphate glycerol 3-phosphate acyltransferase [Candidatus Dependentiae bacterium]